MDCPGSARLHLPRCGACGARASFHPVREYLNGLVWDGVARIDEWLTYYLGAEESLYHHEIGAMFLVAMVRRVFNPGEQSDYMIVLEGDQGEQKSTACRILAGDFYGDQLPSLRFGDQRASQYVKDKWLIEIGELSAFKAPTPTFSRRSLLAASRTIMSHTVVSSHTSRGSVFSSARRTTSSISMIPPGTVVSGLS